MRVSPFVKQCIVASAPLLAAFSAGGSIAFPTVLLHQLKLNESSIPVDFETSTWIGSIHGLAGIPSVFMPTIMQWRGRKFAFISALLLFTASWIVAFTAQSVPAILICECLQGLGSNSILAISFLSISEMMTPKYRETFMQIYFLSQMATMSITGLLTRYLHWKTIALVMFVPTVLALLIALIWPESPYWLAYKGKLNKCEKAFVWLRGDSVDAKKELNDLVIKHKNNENLKAYQATISFKSFWKIIFSRDFYLPAIHMFVLDCLPFGSGVAVVLIYSIELINKSTDNETAKFFSGAILNSVATLGVVTTVTVINKYFSKKTIVLSSACGMIVSLLCASVVCCMQSYDLLSKDSVLCLIFLGIYAFSIGAGVMSTSYSLSVSLMPVKYRGIGGILLIINVCLLHMISLKFSPYLILYIDLWGTFLVYTLNALICSLIIWKFIPDTSCRTLNEIETYYATGKWHLDEVELKECEIKFNVSS